MKFIILAILLILALSNVVPHVGEVKSHVPRTYKVSLDSSLEDRWRPIIKDYMDPLKLFMSYFDMLPIPQTVFDMLDWYAHGVFKHKDFVAEVDVVAKLSGFHFGKIFFLNWMYEFSTVKACSSIIVRDSLGKVMHGRNLDFEMWGLLATLVVNIEYYQGKKLVYSVDTILGSVFALTGMRYGAFAANVDTRYGGKIADILARILVNDALPDVWLLRKVLE